MKVHFGILVGALCVLVSIPVFAQDTPVTYEDVMRVASRMYCPVCENEPLDECRNATCRDWQREIARQLAAGRTDEEIINYFVERYGQHVVGVPQDPGLRFLSFFIPVLCAILALLGGTLTFVRWRNNMSITARAVVEGASTDDEDADYRAQVERDLLS